MEVKPYNLDDQMEFDSFVLLCHGQQLYVICFVRHNLVYFQQLLDQQALHMRHLFDQLCIHVPAN